MAIQQQVPTPQAVQNIARAHQEQCIDRVVDVPADRQLGDAEDSGSRCTKCYSDVKATIDVRLDSVVIVVQAQRNESLANESLHFCGEAASGSR